MSKGVLSPQDRDDERDTTTGASPGKSTLTGRAYVDRGQFCERVPADTDGCFLPTRRADNLILELVAAGSTAADRYHVALLEKRVDLLTAHVQSWNAKKEVGFMLATSLIGGPWAGMIAGVTGRIGVRADKVSSGLTMLFKGGRTELAHAPGARPIDEVNFLSMLHEDVSEIFARLPAFVAEQDLTHAEILTLIETLESPQIVGLPAIRARLEQRLSDFRAVNVSTLGNLVDHGEGREVSCPVWVVVPGDRTYLVLAEAYGMHNSALGLIGETDMTMESLVYKRPVPRSMHDLVLTEFQVRRPYAEVPRLTFGPEASRMKRSLRVDMMHLNPDDYAEPRVDNDD